MKSDIKFTGEPDGKRRYTDIELEEIGDAALARRALRYASVVRAMKESGFEPVATNYWYWRRHVEVEGQSGMGILRLWIAKLREAGENELADIEEAKLNETSERWALVKAEYAKDHREKLKVLRQLDELGADLEDEEWV